MELSAIHLEMIEQGLASPDPVLASRMTNCAPSKVARASPVRLGSVAQSMPMMVFSRTSGVSSSVVRFCGGVG